MLIFYFMSLFVMNGVCVFIGIKTGIEGFFFISLFVSLLQSLLFLSLNQNVKSKEEIEYDLNEEIFSNQRNNADIKRLEAANVIEKDTAYRNNKLIDRLTKELNHFKKLDEVGNNKPATYNLSDIPSAKSRSTASRSKGFSTSTCSEPLDFSFSGGSSNDSDSGSSSSSDY